MEKVLRTFNVDGGDSYTGSWRLEHQHCRPSEETCLIYEGDPKCGKAATQPLREFVLQPRINMQLATFVTLTGIVIEGEGKFVRGIISNYNFIKSALRNATISFENTLPSFLYHWL